MRRLKSFLGKLRAARKARGQPLRYIYVTEGCYPGGRLHHHVMVLNSTGEDLGEIRRLWSYGDNVELRRMRFDRDYTWEDLASYLTKEPREWGHPQVGERTWTPSLGLARPERRWRPLQTMLHSPHRPGLRCSSVRVRSGMDMGSIPGSSIYLPRQPGGSGRRPGESGDVKNRLFYSFRSRG